MVKELLKFNIYNRTAIIKSQPVKNNLRRKSLPLSTIAQRTELQKNAHKLNKIENLDENLNENQEEDQEEKQNLNQNFVQSQNQNQNQKQFLISNSNEKNTLEEVKTKKQTKMKPRKSMNLKTELLVKENLSDENILNEVTSQVINEGEKKSTRAKIKIDYSLPSLRRFYFFFSFLSIKSKTKNQIKK